MTSETQDARDWEGIDQGGGKVVQKDTGCDRLFAEFESEGRTVRVQISAQDLKGFGNPPDNEKAAYTEQVLRAVLETYISRRGVPPVLIDAQDLVNHGLAALRAKFTNQFEH